LELHFLGDGEAMVLEKGDPQNELIIEVDDPEGAVRLIQNAL